MSSSRACVVPLALLLLAGCGHGTSVRAPTARERALIVATVRQTWSYESQPEPAGPHLGLKRPHERPRVLRAGVSRRDPRYASALVELRDTRGRRRGLPAVLVLKRSSAYGRHQWGYPVAGPGLDFPSSCGRRTLQAIRDL